MWEYLNFLEFLGDDKFLKIIFFICKWFVNGVEVVNGVLFLGDSYVIVLSCKIYNDVSCDILSDGKLLVIFVFSV